jgi:hypothetical protein
MLASRTWSFADGLRSELRDPRTEDLDRVAPLNDGDRAGRPAGHRDQPRKRPSELRVGRALRRPAERYGSAGDDCERNGDCD